ncbi:MAG: hypothetical protein HC806_03220 [Anaerolineae bacterium]|nr:hypothetical protein [Anaerolineae bacterium]
MAMMFVMRFGFGGFSLEGKQWWILKSSPIRPFHLILAKYTLAFIPPVLFGVAYLIIAALLRGVQWGSLAYQILAEAIVVAGLSALSLSFGIWGARFDWSNPNEISGGAAGCVGSILSFIFVGISGGIVIGLPLLVETLDWATWIGYAGALLLAALVSIFGGGVPLFFASQRIPRLGEEKDAMPGKKNLKQPK